MPEIDSPETKTWRRTTQETEYLITTDQEQFHLDVIHNFLATQSEWARSIPRAKLETSIRNSLCFGLFQEHQQIGFARVLSDLATNAYLGDVFVLPEYRGHGLSK